MDHTGRNNDALPGIERQDLTSGYFDLQLTFDDQKQLIRSWMSVPGILPTDDSKSKTTCVHPAEHLIPVVVGHTCRFCKDIHDSQRLMPDRFVRVRVSRWNGSGHWMPQNVSQGKRTAVSALR